VAVLLSWGLAGCAHRDGALASLDELRADETMPLAWRIETERGAKLFLLSSIHVGPPSGWVYPPAVEHAFERSSAVVVEVDPAELSGGRLQMLVARYGMLPAGTKLRDRISPETWNLLQQHVERSALPPDAVERMQPWLIGNLLVTDATRRLGLSPHGGVDVGFVDQAGERSVVPLESAEYQLSLLANMPGTMQELNLRDTIERFDDIDGYVTELVDRWRVGDQPGLERLFFSGYGVDPTSEAFLEILIFRRNREMAERLRVLLDAEQHQGETVFVVVGAGHVIGPNGIPALLAERGYRVTPLDRDALESTLTPGDARAEHP
jgi:uncharacterized protein YbaP (TraB family)